jgi:hypothetical protein
LPPIAAILLGILAEVLPDPYAPLFIFAMAPPRRLERWPFLPYPNKLAYLRLDMERRAVRGGPPYWKSAQYPVNSLLPARMGILAASQGSVASSPKERSIFIGLRSAPRKIFGAHFAICGLRPSALLYRLARFACEEPRRSSAPLQILPHGRSTTCICIGVMKSP